MKLFINKKYLVINFSLLEKIAVGKRSIKVSTENIISTHTEEPDFSSWSFMPESHVPDVIKAGIRNTVNGKELWFARGGVGNFITIQLKNENIVRIVLRSSDYIMWKHQIDEIILKNSK